MRNFNKEAKPNESKSHLTDFYIEKAKSIWGDLYDYSKFRYLGAYYEATVICKKHGEFTQDDISQLVAINTQISMAIENAKLFDDVQNIKNYNESILETFDITTASPGLSG